jgi:hypothetical protein
MAIGWKKILVIVANAPSPIDAWPDPGHVSRLRIDFGERDAGILLRSRHRFKGEAPDLLAPSALRFGNGPRNGSLRHRSASYRSTPARAGSHECQILIAVLAAVR